LTYHHAGLLSYRLYRYRREFVRLISARNTTKSRFIRLFLICIIVIVVYVPYTCWLLAALCKQIVDPYSWSRVHDSASLSSIFKAPAFGVVTVDRWGQVATGYVMFFVFGTGCDASNTYKKMLLKVGLGRAFPGLHVMHQGGIATPNSFIAAKTWTSNVSSKAKSLFWTRSGSVADTTFDDTTRNNTVVMGSMNQLCPITTEEPMLHLEQYATSIRPSILSRLFGRKASQTPVLPLFSRPSITELSPTSTHKSATLSSPADFVAHAWANDRSCSGTVSKADGVQVVRGVHQNRQVVKEKISTDDWA
jgi:pheromone a factor receptor